MGGSLDENMDGSLGESMPIAQATPGRLIGPTPAEQARTTLWLAPSLRIRICTAHETLLYRAAGCAGDHSCTRHATGVKAADRRAMAKGAEIIRRNPRTAWGRSEILRPPTCDESPSAGISELGNGDEPYGLDPTQGGIDHVELQPGGRARGCGSFARRRFRAGAASRLGRSTDDR